MRFFYFENFITMNILIVGNGFDLSHYLPTKYDHFMVAMGAIENWDEQKGEMGFDDIFGSLYEKESYFFQYTKAIYQTDEIKILIDQIRDLKEKLKENVWYQYFSDHVREVKTWIDFEKKIEEALNSVAILFDRINEIYEKKNKLELEVKSSGYIEDNNFIYLVEHVCCALCCLRLLSKGYYDSIYDSKNGMKFNYTQEKQKNYNYLVNSRYIRSFEKYNLYNFEDSLRDLNVSLNDLIGIFNFYLMLLGDLKLVKPLINNFGDFKEVHSFNYTNTYRYLYSDKQEVNFLHGKSGSNQNIVLGVSDLNNEYLRKIKAYGFTKYHQKLFKDTDYRFLTILNNNFRRDATIYIWGHSLDSSDENYINEIFSSDGVTYHGVTVVVYYFNEQAKFDLLANLLHILGKVKVESLMKNGWLKFEPNPDVVELNNIEPVDLPKFEK